MSGPKNGDAFFEQKWLLIIIATLSYILLG
jgi:hypothetical protein